MQAEHKKVNWHVLTDTIVVNYDGDVKKVDKRTKKGREVLQCIKDGRVDDIPQLLDINLGMGEEARKIFEIKDGMVLSNGEKVHKIIAKKIIEFSEEKIPFDYLLKFWKNLKDNPSDNSKDQLFHFLEANNFPLTSDGCFIAYKKVRDDYMDDYTGKLDNSVGKTVEMPRDKVVDDPTQSCSAGLHIAPHSYAKVYKSNGRMLQLKVNPRDVVSVPESYADQKSRVCKYEVISDVTDAGKPKEAVVLSDGALKGYDEFAIVDGMMVLNDSVDANTDTIEGVSDDETLMIVNGEIVSSSVNNEDEAEEYDEDFYDDEYDEDSEEHYAKNAITLEDNVPDDTGAELPLGIDVEEEGKVGDIDSGMELPLGLDLAEEEATLELDVDITEDKVNDEQPVAFLKMGNYKYKVLLLGKVDHESIISKFDHRKKSRWAKSFVDLWKKDIDNVKRAKNVHTGKYEYIVELTSGAFMYVVENSTHH